MKILLSSMGCFMTISFFASDINHSIQYSVATQKDIPSLLQLMDCARSSAEDCKRVVIAPAHVQEEYLKEGIEKQRIFIAKDTATDRIVG